VAKTKGASQAGRSKKSNGFKTLHKRLIEQRQEVLDLYEHDIRIGQQASNEGSEDIVDRANSAYNREFMFSLSDNERQFLDQIESALERIEGGTYGSCVHCGEEVGKARLRAVPWAGYCIGCQEQVEQGILGDA
jgi:DnaK suppressor protein